MKLSEAILLGSTMAPQGYGVGSDFLNAKATCAWGAAFQAVGIQGTTTWPWAAFTAGLMSLCPVCSRRDLFAQTVVHINNDHRWTRPQVAAWVATIEPQEVEVPAPIKQEVLSETK